MKKKLISILAAILSMVMLASCGATSTSTSTETSGVPASTASGEKTVITYLRPGNEVEHNAELVQAINDKLGLSAYGGRTISLRRNSRRGRCFDGYW